MYIIPLSTLKVGNLRVFGVVKQRRNHCYDQSFHHNGIWCRHDSRIGSRQNLRHSQTMDFRAMKALRGAITIPGLVLWTRAWWKLCNLGQYLRSKFRCKERKPHKTDHRQRSGKKFIELSMRGESVLTHAAARRPMDIPDVPKHGLWIWQRGRCLAKGKAM